MPAALARCMRGAPGGAAPPGTPCAVPRPPGSVLRPCSARSMMSGRPRARGLKKSSGLRGARAGYTGCSSYGTSGGVAGCSACGASGGAAGAAAPLAGAGSPLGAALLGAGSLLGPGSLWAGSLLLGAAAPPAPSAQHGGSSSTTPPVVRQAGAGRCTAAALPPRLLNHLRQSAAAAAAHRRACRVSNHQNGGSTAPVCTTGPLAHQAHPREAPPAALDPHPAHTTRWNTHLPPPLTPHAEAPHAPTSVHRLNARL